jgi:hypothetical protein
MGKSMSTPTRVASDVAANASTVAPAENRSVAEQISHWARIGMHVERAGSVANRRIMDAAEGRMPFAALSEDERTAAHALADARIAELAAAQSFGVGSRAAGHATVSIDAEGSLIAIAADGTRRPLESP